MIAKTTKQKAEAYDRALELAKSFYEGPDLIWDYGDLERLFPELKQSEDEKIRKELIEHVKDQQSSFISAPDCRDKYEEEENNKYNSWLAWLDKQGKQRFDWSEEDEEHYKACLQYFDEVKPDMVYYKDYQWLKSLKDHVHPQTPWKPTASQMSQLKWIAHQNADNMIGKELMTLYDELKKLIE